MNSIGTCSDILSEKITIPAVGWVGNSVYREAGRPDKGLPQ